MHICSSVSTKTITTEEFDRIFDEGGDITPYLDMSTARHPNREAVTKRVSVDMASGMVGRIDTQARHMAVNRQAVIKLACEEYLNRVEREQLELQQLATA